MAERLNAADEGRVAKAGMREKLRRERELRDLVAVMNEPFGRRFVWGQLAEAGVYRAVFNTSGSVMYFNEGRRDMGLCLLASIMEACPKLYLIMQEEAQRDDITSKGD